MKKNLDSRTADLLKDVEQKKRDEHARKEMMDVKPLEFPLLDELVETGLICEKHGCQLVTFKGLKPFCKQCAKEQIEADNEKLAQDAAAKYHKRTTYDWLRKQSIFSDESIKYATFASYIEDEKETIENKKLARHIAGEYLKGASYNTVFYGSVGTGKSHLSMAMLQAVNEHSDSFKRCLFVSTDELMRRIKDSFSNKQSPYTEQAMVERLIKADLLVLDDLGAETGAASTENGATDYTVRTLNAIVNGRMNKPTIFTTNLSSTQLTKMYDKRLMSRMFRGSKGHVIIFENTRDKRTDIDYGF
ncbi:DnaA ATPase domain-containing protein [Carnobacterium jeotgali]|uniref:DnaA ATPase domain-containing protein n=1 Tax=Carnobacterium jeotgali TaxID=545534 RepID=UPI00068D1AD4|nr:DnaA/Hda family protein [Carnobacterium jeotgali]